MALEHLYPYGLLELVESWGVSGTFTFLLLDGTFAADASTQVYASEFAGSELTDGSYTRVTATDPQRSVTLGATALDAGRLSFTCDDPDFGVLAGSQEAEWLALIHDTGTDATSEIVLAAGILFVPDGSTQCVIQTGSFGVVSLKTICAA